MYFRFANVLVFAALAVALVLSMGLLSALLRPHKPDASKESSYECGEPPTGTAWINFNIRFYLIALVFVIFDVEVAFVYPVAVVFRDWVLRGDGLFALGEIGVFLGILFTGLLYVWGKGDLDWLKNVSEPPPPDRAAVRGAA